MAKIIKVKCESCGGFIKEYTAYFDNGTEETYPDEIPPKKIARFCMTAKYRYKLMYDDHMEDWDSNEPLKFN